MIIMLRTGGPVSFARQEHLTNSSYYRDCNSNNIMMDASDMYPDGFHPMWPDKTPDFKGSAKYYTRTQKPPKYYFLDFGISRRYDSANGPPLEGPIIGGDKTVPEFQGEKEFERSDPFPTDVYYIGNMVRRDFLMVGSIIPRFP
jgi:hypothetical protein